MYSTSNEGGEGGGDMYGQFRLVGEILFQIRVKYSSRSLLYGWSISFCLFVPLFTTFVERVIYKLMCSNVLSDMDSTRSLLHGVEYRFNTLLHGSGVRGSQS